MSKPDKVLDGLQPVAWSMIGCIVVNIVAYAFGYFDPAVALFGVGITALLVLWLSRES